VEIVAQVLHREEGAAWRSRRHDDQMNLGDLMDRGGGAAEVEDRRGQ
jgi:hypothetical protein